MKRVWSLCTCMILVLAAFLLAMTGIRRQEDAFVLEIAPEVLRFHVLANSNSAEDQALKLAVKDYLLEQLRPHAASKEKAQDYIMQNQEELEEKAEAFMRELGYSYGAKVRLENCAFPRRVYGDVVFPAGTYDAVRVLIGEGEGRNFWCVLYPSLCYVEAASRILPDPHLDDLQAIVAENDLAAAAGVCRGSEKKTGQDSLLPRVSIRFKLFERLSSY